VPSFLKTKKDEDMWAKAKAFAEESGHKDDWPYITGIWKQMQGEGASARVADRFLAAYEPGHRKDDSRDPDTDGWVNGLVEDFTPTEGEGSQVPFPRDNQGHPLAPPDLGIENIPGYEWHDKSKAFHSIMEKEASSRTASMEDELRWCANEIDRANDILRDVVLTLDGRRDGDESISDVYGAAAVVTRELSMNVSKSLAEAEKKLRRLV